MENQPFPENVSEWTWETIEELEKSGQSENRYLEYKRHIQYPKEDTDKSGKEWRRDLEREFTAFANASGGMILFGMNDDAEPSPFEPPRIEVSRTVSQLVDNTTPVVRTEVSDPLQPPSEGANRIALAVRVFEATRKPVATSDSAFYVRINDKKHPMSREQIESLFVEADRRQRAVRQLEMEINRFYDIVNNEDEKFEVQDSRPPNYHLLNLKSLKEVLQANTHLYSDDEINENINRIFRCIREIEDLQEHFQWITVRTGGSVPPRHHENGRRNLKSGISKLENALDRLVEQADLDVEKGE